jgi:hypothetical protein
LPRQARWPSLKGMKEPFGGVYIRGLVLGVRSVEEGGEMVGLLSQRSGLNSSRSLSRVPKGEVVFLGRPHWSEIGIMVYGGNTKPNHCFSR